MTARAIGAAALTALLWTTTAPAAAQSLTSIRGLGYPLLSADARTAVLGGLGLGLQGLSGSLANPAAAAGTLRRGATIAVTSVEQTGALDETSGEYGATRFPLIQLLYPVGDVVVTAGYGGYLDQSWAVTREGEELAGGTPIPFRDFVRSTGGIGQVQLGVAVPLGRRFAVGGAIGAHTGSRRVQFQRRFEDSDAGDLDPFIETGEVHYSAPLAQLGVQWDPLAALRLGASVTWSGTLEADSAFGRARSAQYDLPLQVAGGASAYLGRSLLATVSARWGGWGSVGQITGGAFGSEVVSTARDTWEVGGGLEWDDPQSRATRSYPLRIGGSYRQLPFTFGAEAPTEWYVGAGGGMRIGGIDNPAARLDLSVQRGELTAMGEAPLGDLSETAWRFSLALSIFGN